MPIVRPLAEVVDMDLDQTGFGGFRYDAVLERAVEEIRKDGEDSEDHYLAANERG
jgi:hypothetical protein